MSITIDEINFLIHRYLEESNYQHTAFMFKAESMLPSTLDIEMLPPQAIVTILKKGMLYMQMEKAISEKVKQFDNHDDIIQSIYEAARNHEPIIQNTPQVVNTIPPPTFTPRATLDPISLPRNAARLLRAHSSVVYCCSWTSDGQLLASGSEDATAIIWDLSKNEYQRHYVLDHALQQATNKIGVTSITWDHSGTLLATGALDGSVRLFNRQGEFKFLLQKHKGTIYSLMFSPDDQYLLSGSQDQKAIVWDVKTGDAKQIDSSHSEAVLEVAWLEDNHFAAASSDKRISISKFGSPLAPQFLEGHAAPVNSIAYSSFGKALASCSDDRTVRIWWPFEGGRAIVLHGHTKEVYAIKWSPTEKSILLSGAFDSTVRVWDAFRGQCLKTINRHKLQIYSVGFSPKGQYFLSAGRDKMLCIWRTSDFSIVGSYDANSEIYDAQWDSTGKYIAMSLNDSTVAVLDTGNLYLFQE